jgi:hypothetical protein
MLILPVAPPLEPTEDEKLDKVAYYIGEATPNWSPGNDWCMNANNRDRLREIARRAVAEATR